MRKFAFDSTALHNSEGFDSREPSNSVVSYEDTADLNALRTTDSVLATRQYTQSSALQSQLRNHRKMRLSLKYYNKLPP